MIEAALMGGALPGPWSNWEFVGGTNLLASGATNVEAKYPAGLQPGDLVITTMSPLNESVRTTMVSSGWQHWAQSGQDYVCTARYAPGLAAPVYARAGSNSVFVSVLVFRAQGWSTVSLEAHTSPAVPVTIATHQQNELLIVIGLTPRTTRGWAVSMNGAQPTARVERVNAPAMEIHSANVDFPHQVTGVALDALSGLERNLILTIS